MGSEVVQTRFIFLDLETTGLHSRHDEITEAAWILDDGTERHFFVQHSEPPSEWVLKNTDYLTRIAPAAKVSVKKVLIALDDDSRELGRPYLVGACPAFDDRFLRQAYFDHDVIVKFGYPDPPYHYHVIDVEAMAMGALGLPVPPSLKDLRAALGIEGANEAPHTALADAREVRLIFDTLRLRGAS